MTRRNIMALTALIAMAVIFTASAYFYRMRTFRRTDYALNTVITITASGSGAEAAERARTHEAAARATEAATQASDAAAKAAQAASWSAQAANAATAQATSGGAVGSTPVKGPFQSFPYWAVCWLLFFLLMFPFGAGPFAALIFFTIPIYHWVARALDGDWARGDIQVGSAPVTARTQVQDASAAVDTDAAATTAAEPSAKEGDE